ncbi:hypothetical protein MBLNU459_g6186t1 [Dothideomycetes sp. NU459]
MGLPHPADTASARRIWRDPEEKRLQKSAKDALKGDVTAAPRSSIRRRPSVHGHGHARRPMRGVDHGVRRSTAGATDSLSRLYFSVDEHGTAISELPPVPEPHNYVPAAARRTGEPLSDASIARVQAQRRLRQVASERAGGREGSDAVRRRARLGFVPPTLERSRPESRNGPALRPTNLPTPPLDSSSSLTSALPSPYSILARHAQMPSPQDILNRHNLADLSHDSAHPAATHSFASVQRVASPDDVAGGSVAARERRRSSSIAGDVWQVIRSTITPDETLPSTDNSFTSAADSASSQLSSESTTVVPDASSRPAVDDSGNSDTASSPSSEPTWGSDESSLRSSDDDSGPDEDSEENWERRDERRSIGRRLYDRALQSQQGRAQIAEIRRIRLLDPRYVEETRRMIDREARQQQSSVNNAATAAAAATDSSTSAPLPEPGMFPPEVHARSQEAASRTHTFFSGQDDDHQLPASTAQTHAYPHSAPSRAIDGQTGDEVDDSLRSLSGMLTRLNDNLRRQSEAAEAAEVAAMHEALDHVMESLAERRRGIDQGMDRILHLARESIGTSRIDRGQVERG